MWKICQLYDNKYAIFKFSIMWIAIIIIGRLLTELYENKRVTFLWPTVYLVTIQHLVQKDMTASLHTERAKTASCVQSQWHRNTRFYETSRDSSIGVFKFVILNMRQKKSLKKPTVKIPKQKKVSVIRETHLSFILSSWRCNNCIFSKQHAIRISSVSDWYDAVQYIQILYFRSAFTVITLYNSGLSKLHTPSQLVLVK